MKNYEELTHNQKKEFWSKHISHFRKSGLSQKKYCEQENLSYWSFRNWYYKIPHKMSETKFIKVETPCPIKNSAAEITITLPGRIKIHINENISEEVLRKIFRASEVLDD